MSIAIVSGASSGLGRAMLRYLLANPDYFCTGPCPRGFRHSSKVLDKQGLNLDEIWLLGRRGDVLEELAAAGPRSVHCRTFSVDLNQEEGRRSIVAAIETAEQPISLLINAAGGGVFGLFAEIPVEEAETTIEVNCRALVSLTHAVLAKMPPGGRIIQIASVAAFAPLADMAIYAATKAFVLSFSRALNAECRERGVTVTCVCPGTVRTPFFERAYHYLPDEANLNTCFAAEPEMVARHSCRDAKRRRSMSVWSRPYKVVPFFTAILPKRWILAGWQKFGR